MTPQTNSPTAGELGRLIIEEQLSLVERWGDIADRYARDVRKLIAGEIDTVAFGKELLDVAVEEAGRVTEGAARLGVTYYRWLASLAGLRFTKRAETRPRTGPSQRKAARTRQRKKQAGGSPQSS
ncbi:MAG TPA: hypothetical protein VGS09_00780 [Actinomycetota bacterium]|jgi:hypothetical protein|nr:hypothetical protein [Actinomycetota bacterium]